MSRFIDVNKPLSDEEKEYLLTRAEGESIIAANERKFAHLPDDKRAKLAEQAEKDREGEEELRRRAAELDAKDEEDSYHPEDIDYVRDMTIADLRQNLEKRGLRTNVLKADMQPDSPEDDPFTEKQVLALRLLDHLDELRDAAKQDLSKSSAPEAAPTTGAGVVNEENPGFGSEEEDDESQDDESDSESTEE